MTGAARQRRHRARIREGRRVFRIEAPEVELVFALAASGWLRSPNTDDQREIEAALTAAIARLIVGA